MPFNSQSLYLRRYCGFCLGAYLMGLGIALTTNTNLGTTPISSLPYVCSIMTPMSMGVLTFIINFLMIIGQKILLGPAFGKKGLLQLPALLVFSLFIDLNMWLTHPLVTDIYTYQMLLCVIGSFVLANGISLCVVSNATVMPGEGIVLAITHIIRGDFGKIKVLFDCSLVALATLLSFAILHKLEGVGEGTVLSAILTGTFVRALAKWVVKLKPLFT